MKCPALTGLIAVAFVTSGTKALTVTSWRGSPLTAMDVAENGTTLRREVLAAVDFDDAEAGHPGSPRLHPQDNPFNYMRIAKTGSTTLCGVLFTAKARHPEACAKLQWNVHNFFPDDADAAGRSFTVIRNPCDRYLSGWDHVRWNNPPGNPTWNSCKSGLDDSGMQALQSPITWGQFLLQNESIRNTYTMDKYFSHKVCRSMTAMLHQSAWVGENTYVACLPSMVTDLNSILAKEAPGCVFEMPEKEMHNARAHPIEFRDNSEVCEVAKQLYPDDVKLWNGRCGAQHGYV